MESLAQLVDRQRSRKRTAATASIGEAEGATIIIPRMESSTGQPGVSTEADPVILHVPEVTQGADGLVEGADVLPAPVPVAAAAPSLTEMEKSSAGNGGVSIPTFLPRIVNYEGFTMPSVISSIHAELGESVSPAPRTKIIGGEYIELSALLDPCYEENQQKISVNVAGELVIKSMAPGQKINTIEAWTDAFLTFVCIYTKAHPQKTGTVFKYTSNVRIAAKRCKGPGWKKL